MAKKRKSTSASTARVPVEPTPQRGSSPEADAPLQAGETAPPNDDADDILPDTESHDATPVPGKSAPEAEDHAPAKVNAPDKDEADPVADAEPPKAIPVTPDPFAEPDGEAIDNAPPSVLTEEDEAPSSTESASMDDTPPEEEDTNGLDDEMDAPPPTGAENGAAPDSASEPAAEDEGDDASVAFDLPLESVVEAILFSTNKPLKLDHLAKAAGTRVRRERVAEAISLLNRVYEETGRSFEIVEVAETFQMMSRPEFAPYLHALHGKPAQEKEKKYSPAALDTLSIIAYKQPITRADVEAIRGVGCGPIMRQLMERGMIRVVGKKTDIIGHPLLYGTTPDFLKEFGLGTLESLPMIHEFRRMTGSADPLPPEGQPHVQLTLVDHNEPHEEDDSIPDDDAPPAPPEEDTETEGEVPIPEAPAPAPDDASAPVASDDITGSSDSEASEPADDARDDADAAQDAEEEEGTH